MPPANWAPVPAATAKVGSGSAGPAAFQYMAAAMKVWLTSGGRISVQPAGAVKVTENVVDATCTTRTSFRTVPAGIGRVSVSVPVAVLAARKAIGGAAPAQLVVTVSEP